MEDRIPTRAIVRIASSDELNPRFGTGFAIHRDAEHTYFMTCAHVVNAVGGEANIVVDGVPGTVVASGDADHLDLAIVKVDSIAGRDPFIIRPQGRPGLSIHTAGFEHVVGRNYALRELTGRVGRRLGLESRGTTTRIDAWEINLDKGSIVQPGHSGAPVIDPTDGSVVGILRIKQGDGDKAIAISSHAVQSQWPNLASLFTAEVKQETPSADWGYAPDVESLYGRRQEVATLQTWITKDRCRIVGLLGLRGIGKTSLTLGATKGHPARTDLPLDISHGIGTEFDYVVFRSLLNAPPVEEILRETVAIVSSQHEVSLPETLDEQISHLLLYLQKHKCLLILDNFEAVLQSRQRHAGGYREGYEGYGELLRRIGTTTHKSCLLLNSREKPVDVAKLEGKNRPVRTLEIGGVDDTSGRLILDEIGSFTGQDEDWRDLVRLYGGNPLALELAARHISEVFFGNIKRFLELGTPVFSDLEELLDWHLNRLSEAEIEVIYWLALEREPVSLDELQANVLNTDSRRRLPSTLQAIQRRAPMERTAARFSLQPVLIEHVTNKIVNLAISDIMLNERKVIFSHTLQKALARDYVREAQGRLVLGPIIESLRSMLGGQLRLEDRMRSHIDHLRAFEGLGPNYAAGNILNILCNSTEIVDSYDLSGLDIRQAYLQEVCVHNTNLAQATLTDCVFTQTFGPISSLALSPNAELVAASESNGNIHVWRLADFQVEKTLAGHINWVFALAFSPDGRTLASGGEDKIVRLWDLNTDICVRELDLHSNSVWAVAFSPDGRLLATGSEDQTVRIWDVATGECKATLRQHQQKVFAVAFSPNGEKMVSASADHTVKVWDTSTWECSGTLQHADTVRGVSFSPDGQVIASCCWDKTIRLWNLETGECSEVLSGHTNSIHSVVFHPDGEILASSGESGAVRIWNLREQKCVTTLQRHVGEVWEVVFSRDGQILVTGGYDGTLRVWDTRDWTCRSTLHGYIDWVQALAISRDGSTIVGSNGDLTLKVWDLETALCRESLKAHTGWTFAVAFSSDGRHFATGSDDRSIKIWDTSTWEVTKTLLGHSNWVQTVAFSEDGCMLASGSDDRTVKLWNVATAECIRTLEDHAEGIWGVAFGPGGGTLASGSEDHTVKIWDVERGSCMATLSGHEDRIHSVAFDPAGQRIVSCSDDKTVRVWEAASGNCLQVLRGHESWVISAVFDSTGRYIWSGGKDKTLRVWDTTTGECIRILSGHMGGIWSVVYNEALSAIASASEDGSIRIWASKMAELVKILRPLKPYEGINIFGVQGLTEAQKISLRVLGAVEEGEFVVKPPIEQSRRNKTHDYATFAEEYASLGFDGTYRLAFRDIPSVLDEFAQGRGRALDYGCGPGRSTRFLRGLGFDAYGADISRDMLSQAKQQDSDGQYFHIRSGVLPFDDAYFDVVFCSFVFIEVATLQGIAAILQEMKRVLKPNGCIIIVTAPADSFEGDWVSFSYNFPENKRPLVSGDTVKLHIRGTNVILYDYYWADEDYREVFRQVGLTVSKVHRPLGNPDDGVEWLDEEDRAFFIVYVLGHNKQRGPRS
ncbi:methyltransferase domain-containing protein [Streptosporangium sp. NPDC023963]|uniref:WD40 domain-containing protein n=1 Tax=Streptosporangium sp. NPDC023963 TaxID=3155608 RepID=UPI003424911B